MKQFKGQKVFAVFIFLLLLCLSFASFSIVKFIVNTPKDITTTESTTLMISGTAAQANKILINGIFINQREQNFEAMAVLRPGKNLISVTVTGKSGDKVSKSFKVLRIISFDDLKQFFGLREHWAKKQIISLATLGIVEGYADNTFKPEDPVTRGEFATWLARAKGLKLEKPLKDVFYDVPKEHWRAKYIKAVMDAGIMSGISNNIFGIDTPLKRSDAVKIMIRAFKIASAKSAKSPFGDVSSGTSNYREIISAYHGGLIIGTSRWRSSFDPERDMKRAEAVAILSRLPGVRSSSVSLYDFSQGFNAARYCRINTRPMIKKAFINPKEVVNNGRNNVKISAIVIDEQGKADISQVWADLTELGGPLNAKMNMISGESYEISFSVSAEAKPGEKKINVQVMDKSGLKAGAILNLNVLEK